MAARQWTDEQRAWQSAAIRHWRPWEHSTGARTPEGHVRSSRNAFRYTIRKSMLFQRWLCYQADQLRANKPYASISEVQLRASLCGIDIPLLNELFDIC